MKQNAAEVPVHTFQRKAAIAHGGVQDHSGSVTVTPTPDFDLNRTIFTTLEGKLARFVIQTRIAKDVAWDGTASDKVESAYHEAGSSKLLPTVNPDLIQFLVDECDFEVEHADGSFLDHLYFCYEYTHQHMPEHSALVNLLHSILGTGTNTFAMSADKIPTLQGLMNDFEWRHIEAFPSILRLLYDKALRQELYANQDNLDALKEIHFNRVIDNKACVMSAEDLWIQLNYQLIHLADFLPVSNWSTHANDTAFIVFRDLYRFLEQSQKLMAKLTYQPAKKVSPVGEARNLKAKFVSWIPVSMSENMAAKSVRRFSEQIGHSMDYTLVWQTETQA